MNGTSLSGSYPVHQAAGLFAKLKTSQVDGTYIPLYHESIKLNPQATVNLCEWRKLSIVDEPSLYFPETRQHVSRGHVVQGIMNLSHEWNVDSLVFGVALCSLTAERLDIRFATRFAWSSAGF